MPKSPQNGGSNPIFRHSDRTFRTRAWRVAPCRRPAAPFRKFHTKCVPSHLILRMKNSGSEESLAVDAARFCVRHNGAKGSAGITQTSPRLHTPLLSSAPDLSPLSGQGQCRCPRTSDDCMAVRRRMNKIICPTHPLLPFTGTVSSHVLTPSQHLGLSRDCSRL